MIKYKGTKRIPEKFFKFLPKRTRHAMLVNIVDVHNMTGTATMIGDDTLPIVVAWCSENCAGHFCYHAKEEVLLFELETDMVLFLTATPQNY